MFERIDRRARQGPEPSRQPDGPAPAPVGREGGPVADDLSAAIERAVGVPLAPAVRRTMEAGFGTGLGDVRIHRSSRIAPALGARAFTAGADIHLAPGESDTGSAGRELLAHELAHVTQNGAGGAMDDSGRVRRREDPLAAPASRSSAPSRIRRRFEVGAADDPAEAEADRLARRALQHAAGPAGHEATTGAHGPSRIRRSAHTIRRKEGVIDRTTHDAVGPLKDEIAAQYREGTTPEFAGLWSSGILAKIDQRQRDLGGRPTSSHAFVVEVGKESRSQNDDVRAHGWIGSIEAGLRGNKSGTAFMEFKRREPASDEDEEEDTGPVAEPSSKITVPDTTAVVDTATPSVPKVAPAKSNKSAPKVAPPNEPPYDGGHMVAFQFIGKTANAFANVAPQGKALNNGPFQTFERDVLGGAIRTTMLVLDEAKVAKADRPYLIDYTVYVDYPASTYTVSPAVLVAHGLIPPDDIGKLPQSVVLTKRIPEAWRAYAVTLALPSATELGIASRPATPFMFDETVDYGVVDKSNKERTNQEYTARGPKAVAGKFTAESTEALEANPLMLNLARTSFVKLMEWKALVDKETPPDVQEVLAWKRAAFLEPPLPLTKGVKAKYKTKSEPHKLVDSDWVDAKGTKATLKPAAVRALFESIERGDAVPKTDIEQVERYLDDVNKVKGAVAKSGTVAVRDRPMTKDTKIDFGPPGPIDTKLLPAGIPFVFKAKDTQPS